jgi:Protein of unknown function VcgC/VcgE (DUF2780)
MTRQFCLGIACAALLALTPTADSYATAYLGAQGSPAAAAVKASPDLTAQLSQEIGGTPEQAAGAAGALFGLAKTRLKPEEFSQVSKAVPGMDSLLKAAPALGAMSQIGAAGGLAGVASAFSKLGLKPELVSKAVPILTSFVTKSGGANVGSLLAGVLK